MPPQAWDYRLGSRSALEWVLDQYKERKPRDPTIRERFNTYRFADHKERVIDLLGRVCAVSVETVRIVEELDLRTGIDPDEGLELRPEFAALLEQSIAESAAGNTIYGGRSVSAAGSGLVPYSLEFTDTAETDLSRLDAGIARRIQAVIDRMAENAEAVRHRRLTGPYSGQYWLRAGDYRVLYQIDRRNRSLTVLAMLHRSEAYRR